MPDGYEQIEDEDDADAGEIVGKWHQVKSAFAGSGGGNSLTQRTIQGGVSKAVSAASLGTSVTSHAHYLTYAGVGGAAVIGTATTAGLGLAVAGGVMTAVGIGTSAVSAYKTSAHIDALLKIKQQGSRGRKCSCVGSVPDDLANDHSVIWLKVLPYIIEKKRAKLVKKSIGASGLSLATTAARIGKAAYKLKKGTKGKNRTFNAHVLARHAVTHDCWLAEEIISELYSPADYLAIRAMDSEKAGELIAAKMKSV